MTSINTVRLRQRIDVMSWCMTCCYFVCLLVCGNAVVIWTSIACSVCSFVWLLRRRKVSFINRIMCDLHIVFWLFMLGRPFSH